MFQSIQKKEEPVAQTFIQPSMEIGHEDDEHEKEANHVADKVMKMSDPASGNVKQMSTGQPAIKRMSTGAPQKGMMATPKVEQGIHSSKGNGQNLQQETQNEMSSKIGADLSGVNIHTGSNAVEMNKEIGAKAFTHGNDIYFNQGQYDPSSNEGKHLLAHELTHTVQQSGVINQKIQKQDGKKGKIAEAGKVASKSTDLLKDNKNVPEGVITINAVTTAGPIFRPGGLFVWQIKWKTNVRKGYIIQKIENVYEAYDDKGKKLSPVYTMFPLYWEAWTINSAGKALETLGAPSDDTWQNWDDVKMLGINPSKNTTGKWSIKGTFYWVDKLLADDGWQLDNPNTNGDGLQSTNKQPKSLGAILGTRYVKGSWDTKNPNNDKHEYK